MSYLTHFGYRADRRRFSHGSGRQSLSSSRAGLYRSLRLVSSPGHSRSAAGPRPFGHPLSVAGGDYYLWASHTGRER